MLWAPVLIFNWFHGFYAYLDGFRWILDLRGWRFGNLWRDMGRDGTGVLALKESLQDRDLQAGHGQPERRDDLGKESILEASKTR